MKTTQERIDALTSPIARQLFQNLKDELEQAFVIPNELLPEEYRQYKEFDFNENGDRVYGQTIANINKKRAEVEQERSRVQRDRMTREDRVEYYRQQVEETGQFEYVD